MSISLLRNCLLCGVFFSLLCLPTQAQNNRGYRNFPVVLSLQFPALSLPFKNIKSNFSNIGFGVATEVSHGGRQTWVQQFGLSWWRNKTAGNALQFFTQTVWCPKLAGNTFAEMKLGIGYHYAYRSSTTTEQKDAERPPFAQNGKGSLAVPLDAGLGYGRYRNGVYAAPFAGYGLVLLKEQHRTAFTPTHTVVKAGSRIHF